jgi:hypothetical protein
LLIHRKKVVLASLILILFFGYGLAITAINIAALTGARRGEEGFTSLKNHREEKLEGLI